jgi:hypothetical protein
MEKDTMRVTLSLLFFAMIAMLAVSCSDSPNEVETETLTIADLVGSWIATSMMFTNKANTGETFDLVTNGGEHRITVLTGGGARFWVDFGTFHDEWDAKLTLNGNTLTSTPAEASRGVQKFTIEKTETGFTVINENTEFDFTLLGTTPVTATVIIDYIRH